MRVATSTRSENQKRQASSERAAVVVEAALGAGILLLSLFSAFEIAIGAYHAVKLQFVVSDVARWGSLGSVHPNPQNGSLNLSREQSIITELNSHARQHRLDFMNATVEICPVSFDCPSGTRDAGGPGDNIRVSVTVPVRLVFHLLTIDMTASAIVKNEPYS